MKKPRSRRSLQNQVLRAAHSIIIFMGKRSCCLRSLILTIMIMISGCRNIMIKRSIRSIIWSRSTVMWCVRWRNLLSIPFIRRCTGGRSWQRECAIYWILTGGIIRSSGSSLRKEAKRERSFLCILIRSWRIWSQAFRSGSPITGVCSRDIILSCSTGRSFWIRSWSRCVRLMKVKK